LDGDVLAAGASAVAEGRRDYPAFWRYLLDVGREVHLNGLVPVYCCICLPEQVLDGSNLDRVSAVHFPVLLCDEDDLRARILDRVGGQASVANLSFHLQFNRDLERVTVPAPHSLTALTTSGQSPAQTVDHAARWARTVLGGAWP
jgi:hypothetical protein